MVTPFFVMRGLSDMCLCSIVLPGCYTLLSADFILWDSGAC